MSEHIQNLPDLLKNALKTKVIKNIATTCLTAPGENYGSLMLKIDLLVEGEDGEKNLFLIGKKIPTQEFLQHNFNIQVTYRNEVAMYQIILPMLRKFQKDNGVEEVISCFPKFYAARYNLNNSETIDNDAIFILENLISSGYRNVDRCIGFNLESAKLILDDLAQFHAVSLAFRLKNPVQFKEKIQKFCHDFEFHKEMHSLFWNVTKEIIRENSSSALFVDKVNLLTSVDRPAVQEPFATLVHYDLWSNNTMQKFVGDTAVKNVFVDFQFLAYGSPVADLFFFLWTSVQLPVLQKYLETLLTHYHQRFTYSLKQLHCDTKPFSYEEYLNEIKRQCWFEIGHTVHFILFIVNGKKNRSREIKLPDDIGKISKDVTLQAKQRVWYMLQVCHKKNWL